MPVHPAWSDIAIRLLCATLAGILIGFDRGEHGRPAGLRTTILVALAACVAMLQANVLMPTAGKTGDSFVVLDLMRLPLGILSGMGFIGAGAIVRRQNAVLGVTTAATLWFVTVLGLCFGGGQIALGFAGLAIGMLSLSGLRKLESRIKHDREASLMIITTGNVPTADELQAVLAAQNYKVISCAVVHERPTERRKLTWRISWRAGAGQTAAPELIRSLSLHPGVVKVAWTPRTG